MRALKIVLLFNLLCLSTSYVFADSNYDTYDILIASARQAFVIVNKLTAEEGHLTNRVVYPTAVVLWIIIEAAAGFLFFKVCGVMAGLIKQGAFND